MYRKHNWPQIIADFERLGLNISQYAKQHEIAYSTLHQKVNKLKHQSENRSKMILLTQKVHELSLKNTSSQASNLPFHMKLGQAQLEFQDLPNPQWLAEIIKCF